MCETLEWTNPLISVPTSCSPMSESFTALHVCWAEGCTCVCRKPIQSLRKWSSFLLKTVPGLRVSVLLLWHFLLQRCRGWRLHAGSQRNTPVHVLSTEYVLRNRLLIYIGRKTWMKTWYIQRVGRHSQKDAINSLTVILAVLLWNVRLCNVSSCTPQLPHLPLQEWFHFSVELQSKDTCVRGLIIFWDFFVSSH